MLRRLLLILFALAAIPMAHAADSAEEYTMADTIRVTLTLEQSEIIRGESAYFTVLVENISGAPIDEARPLTIHGEALRLEADTPDSHFSVTEKEILGREGGHAHGPRHPPTLTLPPRGKLERSDDTLRWFGELPPGNYKITAMYEGAGEPVTSAPVPLRILPADPVANDAARVGGRLGSAELGAAWAHRLSPAAGGGFLLFYQHQSQKLPRNPIHAVRIAKVTEPVKPLASTLAGPATDVGWVVWSDSRQRLMVARSGVERPTQVEPSPVRTPYAGAPAASPLALANGGVLIPFIESQRNKACIISISAEGASSAIELPAGNAANSPVGAALWLWALEIRLDAVWTKPGGREIFASRLPIDDLASGFTTPQAIAVDDPIVWLDGYYDADSARMRHVGEGEAPPPDTIIWTILKRAKSLALARVNLAIRQVTVDWSIPVEDNAPLEPISSVVTKNGTLALLLATPQGKIMYASTTDHRLCTLHEAAGVEITPAQSPTLMAGGVDASRAWVYVRYIDRAQNRIAYKKLEPLAEPDPMDARPPAEVRLEQPGDWPEDGVENAGGL